MPHCRTRRDPSLAPSASLNRALARSLLHGISGALLRRCPCPWRHAGVGSGLWHVRHRPTTRARQLPQGTARAYPHARRHAFVAATTPCGYSNGDPSSILSTAAEPAPSCYKRRPRAPPSTQATPVHPRNAPAASNRQGKSFLPHLRLARSLPQSSAIRRNRSLPRPTNAINSFPWSLRSCPASQPRSEITGAQNSLCPQTYVRRGARRR